MMKWRVWEKAYKSRPETMIVLVIIWLKGDAAVCKIGSVSFSEWMNKCIIFVSFAWLSFLYVVLGLEWKSSHNLGHI